MRALITLVAMIGLLAAGTSKAGEFASDMETIDTASQHNDVATLEQLQVDLTAITPDYRHAYVAYCLSIARQVSGQNDVAEADLDEAIDILQGDNDLEKIIGSAIAAAPGESPWSPIPKALRARPRWRIFGRAPGPSSGSCPRYLLA